MATNTTKTTDTTRYGLPKQQQTELDMAYQNSNKHS